MDNSCYSLQFCNVLMFLKQFSLVLEEERLYVLKKKTFKKSYPLYLWYPQNEYV